jgi:ribosomal protein S18 acetylase RimI-like enzyme
MKIREFSIEEFAALSQLWRRSGFETRPGDSKEELRRKLKRDSDLFLVAEADSKIVGSVMGAWDGRRGWIYHLAVDPRFRRKHVAKKMLLEVEHRMREKGVLKVNAMVYLWNSPSLNLFESIGFKKQSNMVVMGKTLVGNKHDAKTGGSRKSRADQRSVTPSLS